MLAIVKMINVENSNICQSIIFKQDELVEFTEYLSLIYENGQHFSSNLKEIVKEIGDIWPNFQFPYNKCFKCFYAEDWYIFSIYINYKIQLKES